MKSNDKNNKIRVHIRISGRVQGVAFRYYARNMANRLGIKGWIRNLPDGDVEVVIEGMKNRIVQMISWCKKGPNLAIVENVKIDRQPYAGEFQQFNIRS